MPWKRLEKRLSVPELVAAYRRRQRRIVSMVAAAARGWQWAKRSGLRADRGNQVNSNYLLGRRIVSHNGADQRSRPYDMLRTQVLRSMGSNNWDDPRRDLAHSTVRQNCNGNKFGAQYSTTAGSISRIGGHGSTKAASCRVSWFDPREGARRACLTEGLTYNQRPFRSAQEISKSWSCQVPLPKNLRS